MTTQTEGQRRVSEMREKLRNNEFLSFYCEELGMHIHLPTKAVPIPFDGHPLYFDEFEVYQDRGHVLSDIYNRVLEGKSSTSEFIHHRAKMGSFYEVQSYVALLGDLLSLGYIYEWWATERVQAIVIDRSLDKRKRA